MGANWSVVPAGWAELGVVLGRIRQWAQGMAAGTATLSTGTSTAVMAQGVVSDSIVVVGPKTSGHGVLAVYVSSVGDGTFTLTHTAGAGGRTVYWQAMRAT